MTESSTVSALTRHFPLSTTFELHYSQPSCSRFIWLHFPHLYSSCSPISGSHSPSIYSSIAFFPPFIRSAESAILTPAHSNEQINEGNWCNECRMVLCLWEVALLQLCIYLFIIRLPGFFPPLSCTLMQKEKTTSLSHAHTFCLH